jgi:hypothetical protein
MSRARQRPVEAGEFTIHAVQVAGVGSCDVRSGARVTAVLVLLQKIIPSVEQLSCDSKTNNVRVPGNAKSTCKIEQCCDASRNPKP